MENKRSMNKLSIATLIVAVLAIVSAFVKGIIILCWPLGIAAFVLGIVTLAKKGSLAVGIVAIILSILAPICGSLFAVGSALEEVSQNDTSGLFKDAEERGLEIVGTPEKTTDEYKTTFTFKLKNNSTQDQNTSFIKVEGLNAEGNYVNGYPDGASTLKAGGEGTYTVNFYKETDGEVSAIKLAK
jgi:hypothetical protein